MIKQIFLFFLAIVTAREIGLFKLSIAWVYFLKRKSTSLDLIILAEDAGCHLLDLHLLVWKSDVYIS